MPPARTDATMPDLKLIEAFVFAMRYGSLSAAEAQSGVPKATLSRLIARLEESLGAELLLRSARGTVPTEAGQQFYVRAQRMLDAVSAEYEAAAAAVQNLSSDISGELCIATPSYLSSSFVTYVVSRYMQLHPNIVCRLTLVSDPVTDISRDIDCYVTSRPPLGPHLASRQLGTLRLRLFASAGYLARYGAPAAPADLARHKALILRRHAPTIALQLSRDGVTESCLVPVASSTNDYWILKSMAIDGYGIAVLPDFFAQPEVDGGMLQVVLPEWEAPALPVHCTYHAQRQIGRKLGALLDLMADAFTRIHALHVYIAGGAATSRTG
ncbi:transcriptional regulator LysR family [Cupriavidus necator N-1]|uniref:Transcriptional regulator LysR family n=2 Tax=Cupriavidus necator TaxID=106590 RepID=G0ERV3_CUPNN|nr:transcriptional regulator LysR family [Cupriavidus necator N-1]